MPQFTPSDRETVAEYVNSKGYIHSVAPTGRGLIAIKEERKSVEDRGNVFTWLMEKYGWYPACVTFHNSGTRYTLMPVTEAANDT